MGPRGRPDLGHEAAMSEDATRPERSKEENAVLEALGRPGYRPLMVRELLRELERWCRKHDWPHTTNAWVAEQAVRQCW